MLDSVRCQERDKPHNTHEFLPFSCTVLNKSLVDYAAKYLNESEEVKRRALIEIRDFAKKELDVDCDGEDLILLCFLRSRKYDLKRACGLMKVGTEFVNSHRDIFDRIDSDVVRRTIESRTVGFLPYRDAKGRAIVFIRSECWKPDEIKAEDIIFGTMVAFYSAAENPVNQVAGYVVILDFKNLAVNQVLAMSSWLVFGIQALQRCLPCRIAEFHVTHAPGIFRTAWKVVKPLLNEKIKKRITFYKSAHWDSLHRRIPAAILPEELGGTLGPYSYEHWASDLKMMEKKYNDKICTFIKRKKPV